MTAGAEKHIEGHEARGKGLHELRGPEGPRFRTRARRDTLAQSSMKTRVGVTALVLLGAVLAGALTAVAQPVKMPRIGVLLYAAAPHPGQPSPLVDAFRGGLRDLGYVEGRNVALEYRMTPSGFDPMRTQ